MNARFRRRAVAAAAVLVAQGLMWCPGALAHHSGAMFDATRTVTLQGKVKAFQWTNPHCFIQLLVKSPDGRNEKEWSVEMGSPGQLYRNGWRPASIRAGDQLTVVINPLRDGTAGGVYVSATTTDGKPAGTPRAAGAK
jgi:hypothetical protein